MGDQDYEGDLSVEEIEECEGCGELIHPDHALHDVDGIPLCRGCADRCRVVVR